MTAGLDVYRRETEARTGSPSICCHRCDLGTTKGLWKVSDPSHYAGGIGIPTSRSCTAVCRLHQLHRWVRYSLASSHGSVWRPTAASSTDTSQPFEEGRLHEIMKRGLAVYCSPIKLLDETSGLLVPCCLCIIVYDGRLGRMSKVTTLTLPTMVLRTAALMPNPRALLTDDR